MHESAHYSKEVKVISVNILYFDLGHGDDYIYRGRTVFHGLHTNDELALSEMQRQLYKRQTIAAIYPEYYLIKVNSFNDVAKDTLDEWIFFLKNEETKEGFSARGLMKAKEQLDIMKLPEAERAAYDRYLDDLHYRASMVESTYGYSRLEGLKEGMEQGMRQGIAQGIQQGIEQGKLQEAQEMLFEVLREKFGVLPDGMASRIEAMTSRERLQELLRKAIRAGSLEEFGAFLYIIWSE